LLVQDLTVEECRKALSDVGFGRLACARENQPYVVPVSFAVDQGYAYLFSMPGQMVAWMRENPRVCLEVETVVSETQWTTVVVLGHYEELPDTPEYEAGRLRAREVLKRRITWWEPGGVAVTGHAVGRDTTPISYRISLSHLTGRRGVPAPDQAPATSPAMPGNGWLPSAAMLL
jgi:nitroimidazol reductase NimA-like FMN-containing flavoprotein (pyridoxamine 5'-phosphate oxidase superfamily)